MPANVAIPAVRQKRSKLAPTSCQASSTIAAGTTAADVVDFFMALLSFVGFDTPSLRAQGEQRLPHIFNSGRDIPWHLWSWDLAALGSERLHNPISPPRGSARYGLHAVALNPNCRITATASGEFGSVILAMISK